MPASVAQSIARPTGYQEVADSILAGTGNTYSLRLAMKKKSAIILSLPRIQKGKLSVFCERMCRNTD